MKFNGKIFYLVILIILSASILMIFTGCNGSFFDMPVNTLKPSAAPTPSPVPRDISNDSNLADSIVYANNAANKIQAFYGTYDRNDYFISNLEMKLMVALKNYDETGLYKICNSKGNPFIEGGMTAYVKNKNGKIFLTNSPDSIGRINTIRLGYYYYDVKVRGISFSEDQSKEDNSPKSIDLELSNSLIKCENFSEISIKKDAFNAKVTNPDSPSFIISANEKLSSYSYVILECMADGKVTSGTLYFETDSIEMGDRSAKQFKILPDGSFHKIYIDLSDYEFYGNLKSLKIKLDNAEVNDTFALKNITLDRGSYVTYIDCGYEQTLHSYSDKVVNEMRILYDKNIDSLEEFGYRYKISVKSVSSIEFQNDNGTYSDISKFSEDNVHFVAFDIKKTGVVGIILPSDQISKCKLTIEDGYYVLTHYIDISGTHKKECDDHFSHRIFTSDNHNFSEIEAESYIERNPLKVEAVTLPDSSFNFVKYNSYCGYYYFTMNGSNFNSAYKQEHESELGGIISFSGDGKYDRNVYIFTQEPNGQLECAAILDDNNINVPIPLEVCKNFRGEFEEKYYDPDDSAYGNIVFPLKINKDDGNVKCTILELYQYWGNSVLKQISSIAFHVSYYHLSTGVTESNCIAPYFVYGQDGWTLPDFRGCSGIMWGGQPQYNSVGRLRWLSYPDNGNKKYAEYTGSIINSSGQTYSDIEYSYRSHDYSFEYTLRHVEFPQQDENRTFYHYKITCHRDIKIENIRDTFTLFDFDCRFNFMKNLAYKDINNEIQIVNNGKSDHFVLSTDSPFFTYYNFSSEGTDIENFALLIKDYKIILNGKTSSLNLLLRNSIKSEDEHLNFAELTIDADTIAFKAGDTIELTLILLPYGKYDQENFDNVIKVYEDSIEKPWRILSSQVGNIQDEIFLPRIKAIDNYAEFSLSGGRNNCVIRIDGFTKLFRPQLEEYSNGKWVPVDYNYRDYDGYQVSYTFDGNYSYSFVIKMDDPDDVRSFRIH